MSEFRSFLIFTFKALGLLVLIAVIAIAIISPMSLLWFFSSF